VGATASHEERPAQFASAPSLVDRLDGEQAVRVDAGACEHMFVDAAGSQYAAFRRAIEARNLTRAITEARDLPQISLADAAELVVLAGLAALRQADRQAGCASARRDLGGTQPP